VPHAVFEFPDSQRIWLSQHPAHVASHRHVADEPLPVHVSPALHGGPEPQPHLPAAVHKFEAGRLHDWQLAPLTPQAVTDDGVEQLSCAVQQPPPQAVPLQWQLPPMHS
jgi:hypothetical protein